MAQDSFTFRRDFNGHTIVVTAVFIPRLECWGMIAKLDGEPVAHHQSTHPWEDARNLIDHELLELGLDEGGVPSGLLRPPPLPPLEREGG